MNEKKPFSAPSLPALSLVGSTRFTYAFSRILLLLFVLLVVAILFVPWRQNVVGNGRVIAFDPLERIIKVESQLAGRVKTLNVVEGQVIKKGEVIAEIEDNDPLLMENLKAQKEAIINRQKFAESKVEQIKAQEQQVIISKENALLAAQEVVNARRSAQRTINLEITRTTALYDQGLASRREYEQTVMKKETADADLKAAESLLTKTMSDYDSTLSVVRAQRETALGDIESAQKEIVTLEIKINQTKRQVIESPRDGVVYKVNITDGTYLSPGKQICTVIPQTESRFVEVWLDGNDIALIKARSVVDGETIPGSPVRLAFEGWPSVQTMGWPQLAIGTFGGEVVFIDPASDGEGSFRVVIGPAIDEVDRYFIAGGVKEISWPDKDRWLRQGTLAQSWFLLEQVPMWKEIWRKMNGFPPLIREEEDFDPTLD